MKFFLRHSWLYFILNLWESKHLDSEGYVKKMKKQQQMEITCPLKVSSTPSRLGFLSAYTIVSTSFRTVSNTATRRM